MQYLVVMEVSQKQNYIFKTDRLIENIGASLIIRKITESLPEKYKPLYEQYRMFMGGGNTIFQFPDKEIARSFIKDISEFTLRNYPGIELFFAMQEYNETSESAMEKIDCLFMKLEKKKSERKESFRVYGPGITEMCQDTQLPAVKKKELVANEPEIYLSSELVVKINESRSAQKDAYEDLQPEGFVFAHKFEDLGATENKKSYIAVIVADGNRMGKNILMFREKLNNRKNAMTMEEFNRIYFKEFKELSAEIDKCYREAIRRTFIKLSNLLPVLKEKGIITIEDPKVLPARPLIASGDDICIVTDARIGLMVTEMLLNNIDQLGKFELNGLSFEMHACAGVAMVHNHYPFFRAHELAEELCASAKSAIAGNNPETKSEYPNESVIDWHLAQGEIEDSVSEIRRDKYQNGRLTEKPYFLNDGHGIKSMSTFKKRLREFEQSDIGRSRLKGYRDALADGTEKQFWEYRRMGRVLSSEGYSRGIDFDVIEMLDLYQVQETEG